MACPLPLPGLDGVRLKHWGWLSLRCPRKQTIGRREMERPRMGCGTADWGSWIQARVMRCGAVSPVIEGAPSTQLGRHHSCLVGTLHSQGYPEGRALECLAIQGFLVDSTKSNVIWLAAPAEVGSASTRKVLVHSTEREEGGSFRKKLKWSIRIEGLVPLRCPLVVHCHWLGLWICIGRKAQRPTVVGNITPHIAPAL